MDDSSTRQRDEAAEEIIEISHVDSPSENFLVSEHLQKMPSLFARGLLYIILFLMGVSLLYSAASQIDIVVEARGIAEPAGHKIRILSDRDGYAEKIYVREGIVVEKHAPLFLIKSKETLSYQTKVGELAGSIPLKKEYFDTKIAAARDELNTLEHEHTRILVIKKMKQEEQVMAMVSIEADIAYWQKEIDDLSREFDDTRVLFEKRLASIAEYNNMKSRLENARTQKEKLLAQKRINLNAQGIIREEIEVENTSHLKKKKLTEKEIRSLQLEQSSILKTMGSEMTRNENMLMIGDTSSGKGDNAEGRDNILRAGVAGTISELYFRNPGEYVKTSDLLCTIVPSEGVLSMEIVVANKDIGFIEPGTKITYKFDAFPFSDYGTLQGKVEQISPSAVERAGQGFIYSIKGSMEKPYFEIKGKRYQVKAGMTATAELVTDRKSILSILLKKINK